MRIFCYCLSGIGSSNSRINALVNWRTVHRWNWMIFGEFIDYFEFMNFIDIESFFGLTFLLFKSIYFSLPQFLCFVTLVMKNFTPYEIFTLTMIHFTLNMIYFTFKKLPSAWLLYKHSICLRITLMRTEPNI